MNPFLPLVSLSLLLHLTLISAKKLGIRPTRSMSRFQMGLATKKYCSFFIMTFVAIFIMAFAVTIIIWSATDPHSQVHIALALLPILSHGLQQLIQERSQADFIPFFTVLLISLVSARAHWGAMMTTVSRDKVRRGAFELAQQAGYHDVSLGVMS